MVKYKQILFEFFVKNLFLLMLILGFIAITLPQVNWSFGNPITGEVTVFEPFSFLKTAPWISSVVLLSAFFLYMLLSLIFAIIWLEILRFFDSLGFMDNFYLKVLKLDPQLVAKFKSKLHGKRFFVPKIKVPKSLKKEVKRVVEG